MPRLDNSSEVVIKEFNLNFNPDDPGDTNPVDICAKCYQIIYDSDLPTIDHPLYSEVDYNCAECGISLDTRDD